MKMHKKLALLIFYNLLSNNWLLTTTDELSLLPMVKVETEVTEGEYNQLKCNCAHSRTCY